MKKGKKKNIRQSSSAKKEKMVAENEFLKLKLQAEQGAIFGGSGDLSPEMENEFLNQVQQFEKLSREAPATTVYDLIGKPEFKSENEMTDKQLTLELKTLHEKMNGKNVVLDVLGKYDDRIIYKFITEELFLHETSMMIMPGLTSCFIYEEFHPNHKMDIENGTAEFLKHWFERDFNEYCTELGYSFVIPDGQMISRDKLMKRLNDFFSSFESFTDCHHKVIEVSFELNESDGSGLGHSEGLVTYNAKMESGEVIHFEGPFKLYFAKEMELWSIFYFVFPGFKW